MRPIPTQRHLFDIPEDVAYFNTAFNSPQLNASRDRLLEGVRTKSRPWDRTPGSFFEDAESVRTLASATFGGDVAGWAIVPAASYGLSTAARALEPELRRGDRVLVLEEEFPSNVLPWRRAAHESGAELLTVPRPPGGNWTEAVLDHLQRRVKVAAVSSCHWTDGARLDLPTISRACRAAGAALVVDATQTLGAVPFPLEDVRPDFLVAAGYKWLLCPYGFGLLYASEPRRAARPLEETWLTRVGVQDFAELMRCDDRYVPGARRFDVGETCTATILPGAIAALEQIGAWGVPRIAESLSTVNQEVGSALRGMGLEVPAEAARCPHMLGVRLPGGCAEDLVSRLRAHGVFVSQRGASVRIAPHLHVTEDDVARLLAAIRDLLGPP